MEWNGMESQKPDLKVYNLFIVKDLRQVHYYILLIILLKEFIKLNAIRDAFIKIVKLADKIQRLGLLSWIENFKGDLIEYKCLCCNKSHKIKFDKNLKKRSFNTSNNINKFILLLRKGITYMNTWMIGKKSIKHNYVKKKIFTVTERWKILLMVSLTQKGFVKILK